MGHTGIVFSMFLDGEVLYSGSEDSTVISWNTDNGAIIMTFYGYPERVLCVAVFDGELYAGGAQRIALKWNIETGQLLVTFTDYHEMPVRSLAYLPGTLFTGSQDASVIRWDSTSATSLQFYQGRKNKFKCVVSWNDFAIIGGEDSDIKIWDVSINSLDPSAVFYDHTSAVNDMYVVDDYLYSGSSDLSLRQWNLATLSIEKIFTGKS